MLEIEELIFGKFSKKTSLAKITCGGMNDLEPMKSYNFMFSTVKRLW